MADEDERVASLEAELEETKCALTVEKQAREKAEKQLTDKSRAFNKLYAVANRLALVSAESLKHHEAVVEQTAGTFRMYPSLLT